MIVTHQVTIDLLERKSVPQIEASQNDRFTRQLQVHLYSGEQPWAIPGDVSVVVRYCHSDGTGGEYDTLPNKVSCFQAEENVLTLMLVPQVMAVPGTTILSATLYREEKAISVFSVGILVHPMIRGESSEGIYCNVTGFLPAPAYAEEGQFLRVTQVDEEGRVLTVEGVDGAALGDSEPMEEDIPCVFFGSSLPQTKDEALMSFRYVSKTMDVSGWCTTKAQGNTSMNFPKKNQSVKLLANLIGKEKMKLNFRNWGEQGKYCFKANWIDLTHARNVVSARLWGDVVRSRDDYMALPELYRESPNQGAVDGFPVKVYAGGVYQGRYTLNIPKDPWMAGMDASLEEHCILCGENYASGCFRAAASINGSDWTDEVHDTVPESILNRWNEVISFVQNATDEEFRTDIGEYFYLDSLIDYHLFGLLSCGLDAYGKNQLYMTYDGRKWIAGMYDMDATWGLWWDGATFVAKDYDRSQYQDFRDGSGNLLYIRLEQCFPEEIQARWTQLKSGALSLENILMRFERFVEIAPEALVKEDYAVTTGEGAFTGIPSKTSNNIQQIRSFLAYRHGWCDTYVAGLIPEDVVECTSFAFSHDGWEMTVGQKATLPYTIEPEDCTQSIEWSTTNGNILSIEDGVVTALAEGNGVITAVCGSCSDSIEIVIFADSTSVSCSKITLSASSLDLDGAVSHTLTATVEPADCEDPIVWESSIPSVATVTEGVVKTVGNGITVITATCGTKSAQCSVTVSGMEDNLLAPLSWHVGEVSDTTGELVDTSTLGRYTDAFDVTEFANTIMQVTCVGVTLKYSRVVLFDENMAFLGYFSVNGMGKIPTNAKYARISIYSGAGNMLEIRGGRENFWTQLEVTDGSYAGGVYKPGDTGSGYIRVSVAPEEQIACTGSWGVAFLDSEDQVAGYNTLSSATCGIATAPDGAEIAAVCSADSAIATSVCNRLQLIGYGAIG